MDFSSSVLSLEIEGHVATLWLDRPDKRNAMGPEFIADLPRAMATIGNNEGVRVAIIAGRGKSFCVGIDLASLGGGGSANTESAKVSGATASLRQMKVTRDFQEAISSVADCPVPVIAATEPPPRAGPLDVGESGIFLQLGAFSTRDNAQIFVHRMRSDTVWLGDSIHLYKSGNLYKVHAGPYANRAAADRDAVRVYQELGLTPIVLSR